MRDERSAQSRLDDILGSETRNAIAKHDLIEVIRTTKERKPLRDESLDPSAEGYGSIGVLQPIQKGRTAIELEFATPPNQLASSASSARRAVQRSTTTERGRQNLRAMTPSVSRLRRAFARKVRARPQNHGDRERDLSVIESEATKPSSK